MSDQPTAEPMSEKWLDHYRECARCGISALPTDLIVEIERLRAANAELAARVKGLETENLKSNKIINLVVGLATSTMIAVGMNWDREVAKLCNFAGAFELSECEWKSAHVKELECIAKLIQDERQACAESIGEITVANTCCVGTKYSAISAIRARGQKEPNP